MLHIILCILKIIGILLAALVLLLLLILLAVIFVPLRYRLAVVQLPDQQHGEASVTWLLHLIRVSFTYDLLLKKTERQIRICGIRIGHKKEKREQKAEKEPEWEPESESETEPEWEPEPEPETVPEQESEPEPEQEPEPEPEPEPVQVRKKRRSIADRFSDFLKNLVYKVRHICDTIKKIPGRIQRILSKPQAAWDKLMHYRQILDDYDVLHVAGEVRDKLFDLLHHYRVRKGTGFFRFGTGDPAAAAEMAGVLYVLMPVSCGTISIEPQFTDAMLQADLAVKGHIRIYHLLRALWWGFRNKKLRRIIDAVRNRSYTE